MAILSQKAIRAIVQEAGTISKGDLVDALDAADVDFNAPLLDGFLEQAKTKGWLEQDGKNFNIKKRVGGGGGGTPTKLFKVDNSNPLKPKMTEIPYDAKAEAKDPMLKRTEAGACKVEKADWYLNVMVPQREARRALAAKYAPAKVDVESLGTVEDVA